MRDYRFTVEVRGLDDEEGEVDAVVGVLSDELNYVEHLELEDSSIVRAVGDVMSAMLPEELAKDISGTVFYALDRFAEIEVRHFDYASIPQEIFVPDMDDYRELLPFDGEEDEEGEGEDEPSEDVAEGEEPDDG